MNDHDLDRLIAGASPVRESDVRALDLAHAESELKEQIMAVEAARVPRLRLPRVVASVATVAALCLVIAGIATREQGARYLPMARAVAESNLRILPGTPGWTVTRADEFTVGDGEMTFGDGHAALDVHWEPAKNYAGRIDQAHKEGDDVAQIKVLGRNATIWRYKGTTDYVTVLEPEGSTDTYIRGDLGSGEAYRRVIDQLRQASIDEWLAAMPASVVKPADRAATVDAMLRDIPQPPGFDASKLRSGDVVKDRYQLGAEVSGAVACAWIARWTDGDAAQKKEAADAMATSHHWKVLQEMNPQGDYPEVLWEYADAMNGAKTIGSGMGQLDMDQANQLDPNAHDALGCD